MTGGGADADSVFSAHREFPASMPSIQRATEFLGGLLREQGVVLADSVLFEIRLAVTEVFANIVEHGYRNVFGATVGMDVQIRVGALEIRFRDRGGRPQPHLLRGRELTDYRERGLGLFLITRCMDETHFVFGADGENVLQLIRKLAPRDESPLGKSDHLPFYTALYEQDSGAMFCLIGSYLKPRARGLTSANLRRFDQLCFHLGLLQGISASAASQLVGIIRELRGLGVKVLVTRPHGAVMEALREAGLSEALGSAEYSAIDSAAYFQARSGGSIPLDGQYLPLIRVAVSCGPGAVDSWARLHPEKLVRERYEANGAMRWSDPSSALFVRTLEAPSGDPVVFIGGLSHRGPEAFGQAAPLFAMVGGYRRFAERYAITVGAFIDHLSRLIRTISARATSELDSPHLIIAAVEFGDGRMTYWSGNDREIVREGETVVRSITLGTSEVSISKPIVVPFASSRVRFHLGSPGVWPRPTSLDLNPGAALRESVPDSEAGILDVILPTK